MSEKRAPPLPSSDPTMVGSLDEPRSRQGSESVAGTDGDATESERDQPRGPAPDEEFARGTAIGRYIVLGIAGYGGMGVVYRAYDPELHREVAIKLLRADRRRGKNSATAEERLRREAQAMARVSHANVLPVYDVGTAAGRVFVAMEFCSVPTLSEWLDTARSWREILDVFVAAGRGLAAAHAVGILHRDFKPQNVFVGDDGRVRVTDFGLARVLGGPMTGEDTEFESGVSVEPGDSQLTLAGSVVGTPRYMAPEQHVGTPLDARTDQFSFCVALYEALYKVFAYGPGNVDEMAARKLHGDVHAPESEKHVPRWVKRVLTRGLEGEPAKRWSSMDELLAALEHRRRTTRRQRAAAALVGVGALAAVAAVALVGGERPCRDAARKLDGVWDDDRREQVASGIDATGLAFAADTRERVVPRLDAWADEWVAAHTAACEATKIHGEQSEELLDLRVACLDRARGQLDALATLLVDADAKVVERAVIAADRLPQLAACADAASLLGGPRPPSDPSLRARVERLERVLADGEALSDAGKYTEAVAVLEPAVAEARELGHPPLLAEAIRDLADAVDSAGDPRRARALLVEALSLALSIDAVRVAETAARSLVYVDGHDLRDAPSGHDWARLSEGLAVPAGSDPRQALALANSEAVVFAMEGDSRRAKELFDLALSTARTVDPGGANMGVLAGNAGAILAVTGDYASARAYFEEALEIYRVKLGPRHPLVGQMLANLGALASYEGRYQDAAGLLEQARQLQEETLGTEHIDVASTYNNLASMKRQLGDTQGAIELHRKALAIRERVSGKDNLTVAQSLDNLAIALAHSGGAEEGRRLLQRSLEIKRSVGGDDNPEIAHTLMSLSEVERAVGRDAEAIAAIDRALAMREKALGSEHPLLVVALYARATLHERNGRAGPAIVDLERAAGIGARRTVDAVLLADVRWHLGRLLWAREPARARELVEQALAVIEHVKRGEGARAGELEEWLAAHRVP